MKESGHQLLIQDQSASTHNPIDQSISSCQEPLLYTEMCGALLKSGLHCTRRDMFKCPFHGTIVPRYVNGVPFEEQEMQLLPSKQPWELMEAAVNASLGDKNVMLKKRKLVSKAEAETGKVKKRLSRHLSCR